MNFFKQFKQLGSVQSNLQTISKVAPKPSTSVFGKVSLWSAKRNQQKQLDVQLVSYTDKAGNTDITSLVIEGKLVGLAEARQMIKDPIYKNTNLSVIVDSLSYGTNLREKDSTGLKIGSKLYRDASGNVYLNKADALNPNIAPAATIKKDTSYVNEAVDLLKDIGRQISLDDMNIDSASFKERSELIKSLMNQMKVIDALPEAHKTPEIKELQKAIMTKASGLDNILSEMISLDNQVSMSQLDFLDKATSQDSQKQIGQIIADLSRAASGPDMQNLDKLFATPGLIGAEKQAQMSAYIKSKALAKDTSIVREGLIKNLAILEQSFALTQRSNQANMDNNISLNLLDLSAESFGERLKYVNDLMTQISGINKLDPAYQNSEITDLMNSITSKAGEVSSILSEMIALEERADNNINVEIEQFDFLDSDDLDLLHEKITEITDELKQGLSGPNMQAIEDLLAGATTLTQEKKESMAGYIKDKVDSKDRAPVTQHIVNSLTAFETSLGLIRDSKTTVKDIGDFIAQYVQFQDEALHLRESGKLSAKDLMILDKINGKLAQNISILTEQYTEHLQDLDLEHNTHGGTNLRAEQEFLRGITHVLPGFEHASDVASNLVHFAENAGFKGENQMSALSSDVKSKILQHYASGTLSRPMDEPFEEASRRDKSQSVFYTKTLLHSFDQKLPKNQDGSKDIRGANVMLDPVFSGDYQMTAMMCSSLKNPNDISSAFLDDYILHLAQTGGEIMHPGDEAGANISKRKNLLEHQIRIAKRDLTSFVKVDSMGSIKLSESLNAARALGVEDKRQDIDLLFVYAALSEIKLDTLIELEAGSDKSEEAERKIFARRVGAFVDSLGEEKLKFLDSPEFQKLGINPKMVEQADIIIAIARTGFSNFKSLNSSLQKLSISAKILSSDPLLRETLVRQFMANDIDLLSRELQSNSMAKLFDMGHVQKGQVSSLLDSEKLTNKRLGHYAEAADNMAIERRSTEVSGIKVGRRLTNLFASNGKIKMPNGQEVAFANVGDVMRAIKANHLEFSTILTDKDFYKDAEELKPYMEFEKACLDQISGNIKSTAQITHFAILYGFDQMKAGSSDLGFSEYLTQLQANPSAIKDHLIKKFNMPETAQILLDTQIRQLSHLTQEHRMQEMLKWHDDVHISDQVKDLKDKVDKQSAAVGGEHLFSGLNGLLAPMKAGDEFLINQSGKVTIKNDHEFVNLAQEVLTEGSIEVVGKITVLASNALKIVKEEKGYSVIFNHAMGVEFGLGMATAMGLAEATASVGAGLDRGYKITFGDSEEQKRELSNFIRTVFYEPGLKVDDLARAESIYISKGHEVNASIEASIGLPSVINSIAVGTGLMPSHETVQEKRDDHLGDLSAQYRVGESASVSKRVSREVKRGEQIVTQSYTSSVDFSGIAGMETLLIKMGVGASSLHSKYSAVTKTTEKYGMITDHVIRTEMTVESDSDSLTQADKSLLALSSLLKGSYEHDIFMNDEEFKAGFKEKLELYEDKSPIIIVERRVRPEVLEELTAKAQELMNEYNLDEATKRIAKLTEQTLNNPDNIEISRVLIRSEQKQLRAETFKTTEVKAQTSDEVAVNRRALEEERAQRKGAEKGHEHTDKLVPKPTTFRAEQPTQGGRGK